MFFNRSSAPELPRAAAPLPPAVQPAAVPPAPPPNGTPRSVILVVDDSTMIRSAVVKTLEAAHYEVIQAVDGVNGLEMWQQESARITLVLSDVFMPRMDGLSMARELRKRCRSVPIVLMSSKLDEDSRWVAEEAGFRLLPKPFKDALLLELIARMIRLRAAS